MNNYKISVVMPLFNKAESLVASVRSVQSQTISDWELVIVDDGSTDNGIERVRALADPRIKLISQSNQGVSVARNRGIKSTSADLIAFLDADDEWEPQFLSTILSLFHDYPNAAWYATGYQIRHPREGVFHARLSGVPSSFKRGLLPDYFKVAVRSDPPVWSSAVAVRRQAIESIGGFPSGITSGEDLLTWAHLAICYPLAYDRRALAVFHVSGYDRPADPEQRVSTALKALIASHPGIDGLRAYLGLWCRMQAIMALRFNHKSLARHCAWQAVSNAPLQWRNPYTLLLAWLPEGWRHTLDGSARSLIKRQRIA